MSDCAPIPIPANHPAFNGHFPGRPILPGVVLLDAAARLIASTLMPGAAPRWRVSRVKFFQPALPGDRLTLHWERTASGDIGFWIERAEQRIASGSLRRASE